RKPVSWPPHATKTRRLTRPPAWPIGCARTGRQRLTAARRELAAVVPPSGECGCVPAQSWRSRCVVTGAGGAWSWARGSGGGERVVAELGQDVAGLPDDLAGLRQGGALGVLAAGDCGVVAVGGGRGAGGGLAGLR